jgi:hypothetical protein
MLDMTQRKNLILKMSIILKHYLQQFFYIDPFYDDYEDFVEEKARFKEKHEYGHLKMYSRT